MLWCLRGANVFACVGRVFRGHGVVGIVNNETTNALTFPVSGDPDSSAPLGEVNWRQLKLVAQLAIKLERYG